MVRTARVKSNSGIYHIMLRGINKQLILEDEEDNQNVKEVLQQCKEIQDIGTFLFCHYPFN